jgi:hypothetical protein
MVPSRVDACIPRAARERIEALLMARVQQSGTRSAALVRIIPEGTAMARCDTCGNDYDKTFEVRREGRTYTFDCLECAAHALAPKCGHCECRILGHGVEEHGAMYCCASCARAMGIASVRDRGDVEAITSRVT